MKNRLSSLLYKSLVRLDTKINDFRKEDERKVLFLCVLRMHHATSIQSLVFVGFNRLVLILEFVC